MDAELKQLLVGPSSRKFALKRFGKVCKLYKVAQFVTDPDFLIVDTLAHT